MATKSSTSRSARAMPACLRFDFAAAFMNVFPMSLTFLLILLLHHAVGQILKEGDRMAERRVVGNGLALSRSLRERDRARHLGEDGYALGIKELDELAVETPEA